MAIDWNFLEGGYFETRDGQRVIRSDLMTIHAEEFGKHFASRDRRYQVSSTQLRGFYADAKALETKIRRGGEGAFDRYLYLIKMMKSKASYIQGKRTGGRVSEDFRRFIHICVDAIETQEDFDAFMKFFEATVGFYYGYGGERI